MYVVCYDIPADNNKLRNKVFKLLRGYGEHVQYSVFECALQGERFEKLYGELVKLLSGEEGSIRIYDLCAACKRKIRTIGTAEEKDEGDEELDMIFL